jgi:hypothetical protein
MFLLFHDKFLHQEQIHFVLGAGINGNALFKKLYFKVFFKKNNFGNILFKIFLLFLQILQIKVVNLMTNKSLQIQLGLYLLFFALVLLFILHLFDITRFWWWPF